MIKGDQYQRLLKEFKVGKGEKHNYTSMKGGTYYVPENETENFYRAYLQFINNGNAEYLTEKQINEGNILVDLDFRHNCRTKERLFTEEHLSSMIDTYTQSLKKLVVLDNKPFKIYVFQKPNINIWEKKEKGSSTYSLTIRIF